MDERSKPAADRGGSAETDASAHLAAILATAPVVLFTLRLAPDDSWSFTYASDRLPGLLGVSPQALRQDAATALEVVHPDDVGRLKRSLAASVRALRPWRAQFRMRRPQYGDAWIEGRAVPMRAPDGGVLWHGFFSDITCFKRLEARLRVKSVALENALAAFWIAGPEGRIRYANRTAVRMWGYSGASEIVGRQTVDFCADRETLRQAVAELDRTGQSLLEFTARRQDGTQFEALMSILRTADERGRPMYLGTALDITTRKRTEEELRRSQQRLQDALDAGEMGVWEVDLETNQIYWDETLRRIYGWSPDALGSNPIEGLTAIIHPEDIGKVRAEHARVLDQQDLGALEFRVVRPDGTERWISARGRIERDREGRPRKLTGLSIDITERKKVDDRRLQSQKLEALGTLAGGIAHDFNNLLTAIIGNVALAQGDLPPDHPVQRNLEEIDRASARASDLVRRILTFSRPEEPRYEELDLAAVAREAVQLLRATIPASIDIRLTTAPDAPIVAADSTQVHQAIVNLATNAVYSIGTRPGFVHIAVTRHHRGAGEAEEPASLPEGDYACLEVRDDGTGIDPSVVERIFDPFFTTKPTGQGTGLGLSVVHGIMRRHHGAVTVASEPGRGSTFRLYFPALETGHERPAPPPREEAAGHGELVLYVDDEEGLVRVIAHLLRRLGYEVRAYRDAAEALAAFEAEPDAFDVMVTDLAMPGMSGYDLLDRVRAIRPDMPVIVTSGSVQAGDHARALARGARELIAKPDAVEKIAPAIRRALAGRRADAGPAS
ncbi:MAG TPA: PAS domain-containing protein [Vicinamibacterales bacterium]